MSRRKDENDMSASRENPSKLSFSKPLTELSKKAEDEVNHLTSTLDRNKINSTLHHKSNLVQTMQNSSLEEPLAPTLTNTSNAVEIRGGMLNGTETNYQQTSTQVSNFTRKSNLIKIDETLQNLAGNNNMTSQDMTSQEGSNQVFLQKLRTQITSMSLDKGG